MSLPHTAGTQRCQLTRNLDFPQAFLQFLQLPLNHLPGAMRGALINCILPAFIHPLTFEHTCNFYILRTAHFIECFWILFFLAFKRSVWKYICYVQNWRSSHTHFNCSFHLGRLRLIIKAYMDIGKNMLLGGRSHKELWNETYPRKNNFKLMLNSAIFATVQFVELDICKFQTPWYHYFKQHPEIHEITFPFMWVKQHGTK